MTSSAKNKNMTKKNLKQLGMGSHEFSPNQKIVSGGFPWTLGTELKNHRRTGRGGEGGCRPPKFWATQIFWAARENLGKASF